MHWQAEGPRLARRLALAALLLAGSGGSAAQSPETYGPTGPRDTLWSIAGTLRPQGATMEQTMLALVRLNPQGFVGPLGNLVRAGATLRAPTAAQAQAIDPARARRIVAGDEGPWADAMADGAGGWRETAPESRPQTPVREAADIASAADDVTIDVTVNLAAGVAGDDAAAASEPALVPAANAEAERSEALRARLDAARADAAAAREQVDLRDEELAAVQAQLGRANAALREAKRQRDRASPLAALKALPTILLAAFAIAGLALGIVGFLLGRAGKARALRDAQSASAAATRATVSVPVTLAAEDAIKPAGSDVAFGSLGAAPIAAAEPASGLKQVDDRGLSAVAEARESEPRATEIAAAEREGVVDRPQEPFADERADEALGRDEPAAQAALPREREARIPRLAGIEQPSAPAPNQGYAAAEPPAEGDEPLAKAPYPAATKLNMAVAYANLGDRESARSVCAEVIAEGNEAEREEARTLLEQIDEQRE